MIPIRWVGLALCAVALFAAPPVAAQSLNGGSIDLQIFRPAMDSKGYITLNASQILGPWEPSFGFVTSWGRLPLHLKASGAKYDVNNLVTPQLQAAIGLFRYAEFGVGVPFTVQSGVAGSSTTSGEKVTTGEQSVGDLQLHLKGRFLPSSKYFVGLGALVSVMVPTQKGAWGTEGGAVIYPQILLDKDFGRSRRLRGAINVGARILTGTKQWTDNFTDQNRLATGLTVQNSSALTFGAGISYAVVPHRFDVVGEAYGAFNFKESISGKSASRIPAEVDLGIKLYLARNSFLLVGAGAGANPQGFGAPQVRVFGAFIFEPRVGDRDGDGIPDDVDKCPDDPEDFDDFEDEDGCPDPDNDRDGIPDVVDKCPNEPETYNGFEDEDGCPDSVELDRDGDGIPDSIDKCPDEPEDKDGFQDEDGCPDPDNDGDGIPDTDDMCPNEPEDKDGFEDEDGCPDPDNDKDGIPDKDDKCPNEPETYNGFEDEDGCPDKGRVIVRKGKIEILDKIYFETDKAIIKPISFPILNAIAATLKGNPQILLIEIQGHADERGSHEHNDKLTSDRAHSVMVYLTEKGIEAPRLQSNGYGKRRPICPQHNEACWSKNRRVEFVILKRSDEGKE
jgi:outer membrane protein OmpA-like peptidoglycan-associated protein